MKYRQEHATIDAVILRDRDDNTAWTSAADGTLEQRRYLCHNWRSDVSAVVTSGGVLAECMKYSSYGVPFGLPGGDTDSDGDWDATDAAAIGGAYTILEDVELDGDVDAADVTAANGTKSGYYATGRGTLSAISIRKGYAGYERAFELFGTKWHVRHRMLDSELGRWTRRDPLGYVDGVNLSTYGRSTPVSGQDPSGLAWYGNYCGPGGSGTPINLLDLCCYDHDQCYASCGAKGPRGVFFPTTCSLTCDFILCGCAGTVSCGWDLECQAAKLYIQAIFCTNSYRALL